MRVFIQLGKTKNCTFDESQVLGSSHLRGVGNPSFSWESQIIIRQRDVWKKQIIPLIIHKKIYPWYALPSSDKEMSMPFFGVRRGAWFLDKINYANHFPGRRFIIIIILKRRKFYCENKQKLQPSLIQDNASKTWRAMYWDLRPMYDRNFILT